ncbi:MAG TPA: adenosylcobinamide-GDP ribazoletransferase [Symbiobacteriaceae bacterium]
MRVALSFLTRLPVGNLVVEDYAAAVGRAVPFFPVVGLIVGLCALAADAAAGLLFGPAVRAAAAVIASVAVTGAFHLDGLMDTADGVLSSRDRQRMLEIMRDSRVGAMGVVAGTLSLLMRFALLLEMPPALRWRALLTAPLLGRTTMGLVLGVWPSARGRGQGMGGSVAAAVGPWQVAGALAVGLGLSLLVGGGWRGAAAWLAALVASALTAQALSARLGGLTGDTYGAINEVVEIVILALYAAAWRGGA